MPDTGRPLQPGLVEPPGPAEPPRAGESAGRAESARVAESPGRVESPALAESPVDAKSTRPVEWPHTAQSAGIAESPVDAESPGTAPSPGVAVSPGLLESLQRLTDAELVARVEALARREHGDTALLVAHLAELDTRDSFLRAGFSSLFTYCRDALGLSEHESYNRIEVARAARRFPVVLELLASGAVNLTTVRLLAPHLTPDNHPSVLEFARGKKRSEVEEIVARLAPFPEVPPTIRKLPPPRTVYLPTGCRGSEGTGVPPGIGSEGLHLPPGLGAPGSPGPTGSPGAIAPAAGLSTTGVASDSGSGPGPSAPGTQGSPLAQTSVHSQAIPPGAPTPGTFVTKAPALAYPPPEYRFQRSAEVTALAPDRYRLQCTIGGTTLEKLRLAQDMLRHAIPSGDEAAILDRAFTALLVELARTRFAAVDNPQPSRGTAPGSRHVPAEVKRAVWVRDLGRCAFVSTDGRRCNERAFVEFHHVKPYAAGGEATVDNIQLRCRRHNGYEARSFFDKGPDADGGGVLRERRAAYVVSETTPGSEATVGGETSPMDAGGLVPERVRLSASNRLNSSPSRARPAQAVPGDVDATLEKPPPRGA